MPIRSFRFRAGTWIHLKSVLYSRRWDLYSSKIGIFCLFLSHLFNPCSVSSFLFFLGHGPILQSFYKIGAIFKHILNGEKCFDEENFWLEFQDPTSISICMFFYKYKRYNCNLKKWVKQDQKVPSSNCVWIQ